MNKELVIPAKAGIQILFLRIDTQTQAILDSRFHGNDRLLIIKIGKQKNRNDPG